MAKHANVQEAWMELAFHYRQLSTLANNMALQPTAEQFYPIYNSHSALFTKIEALEPSSDVRAYPNFFSFLVTLALGDAYAFVSLDSYPGFAPCLPDPSRGAAITPHTALMVVQQRLWIAEPAQSSNNAFKFFSYQPQEQQCVKRKVATTDYHVWTPLQKTMPSFATEQHRNKKKCKTRKVRGNPLQQNPMCRNCGAIESPEWRRGPDGPFTLCNACGLRFWKEQCKKREEEEAFHVES